MLFSKHCFVVVITFIHFICINCYFYKVNYKVLHCTLKLCYEHQWFCWISFKSLVYFLEESDDSSII